MLAPDVCEEVAVLVRSGFYDRSRLIDIFCEEMYAPGDLNPAEVAAAVDIEIAKLAHEKKAWPSVTDCDRLDVAFNAIVNRGVIALHNTGNTQSDGYDDFRDAYSRHPNKAGLVGYCFYHGQDVERAVRGAGLYLAFGPVDPNDEDTKGPAVGAIIREELERAGLPVEWGGDFASRMRVPKLLWQKR